MGDWLGYLQTAAKAKTGVSGGVVVGGILAAAGAVATLVWLSITLFIWIAERYDDPTLAGLVLSGIYLLITVIAAIFALAARRLNRRRAEAALQARKAAFTSTLLSGGIAPTLLSAGLEIGRSIGWRRLVMLAGVALLTTGLVREWTAREARRQGDEDQADPPPEPDLRPECGPAGETHPARAPAPAGRSASRPSSARPAPADCRISARA